MYERVRRGRKCNRIKNETLLRQERKAAKEKPRAVVRVCWSDNIRIYLFSPRNLYTECLAVSG